jgi:hypothetical protein
VLAGCRLPALACTAAALGIAAISIVSAEPLPTGRWLTFEEKTGNPRAEILIQIRDDILEARIVRVLSARDAAYPRCDWCSGERKDAPFIGMVLLEGMRRSPRNPEIWEGGHVLDPDSGKLFRARVRFDPSGERLELRGYVGIPLNGRSQTWRRVE